MNIAKVVLTTLFYLFIKKRQVLLVFIRDLDGVSSRPERYHTPNNQIAY